MSSTKTAKIKIIKPEDLSNFVNIVTNFIGNVDVSSENNHYTVDAKSLMGVLSLDWSNPMLVTYSSPLEMDINNFIASISKYIVK